MNEWGNLFTGPARRYRFRRKCLLHETDDGDLLELFVYSIIGDTNSIDAYTRPSSLHRRDTYVCCRQGDMCF
jgi:hypothetical protein